MAEGNRGSTIGIVGVGVMGGGMAGNIIKKGHPVIAFDLDKTALDDIVSKGAGRAFSAREVADKAAILICMVETTAQSEEVIMGENGFLPALRQGDVVISSATMIPQL